MPDSSENQNVQPDSARTISECSDSDATNLQHSKSAKRQRGTWEADDNMEDNDGFTLVENNRKKSKNIKKQEPSTSQSPCQQQTRDTFRLAFPKGVSPRDRMVWLAEVADKHRNLSVVPRATSKTLIAVTHDKDTVKFLTEIGYPYKEGVMKLTEITSDNQRTKLIILNYPSCLPLTFIENLPSVLRAERNYHRDTQEPRNQVTMIWEGEPPTKLQLPGIRTLKVEKFIGKPTFCGKCQEWGHHVWECDKKVRCGFCSENHDTKICKEKLIKGETIVSKCPNCSQEHNAWSFKCPMKPIINRPRDARMATTAPPPPLPPATAQLLPSAASPPPPSNTHLQSGQMYTSPATQPHPNHLTTPPPPPDQPTQPSQNSAPQTPSRPFHPPASRPPHAEPLHPPQLQSHAPPTQPPVPQMSGQPSPPASQPTQAESTHLPQTQNHTHNSQITSKLEEEVKTIRQEMRQMQLSQTALQNENKELRQQMANYMKKMETEMASMKTMMTQLIQTVTGTKPKKQQHSEPSGMAKDIVDTESKLTIKEPHQREKPEMEAMDTCHPTDQLTDCPTPPPQSPRPHQTYKQLPHERGDKTPSLN